MIVLPRRTPPRREGSTGITTWICQTIASVGTCMRPSCIERRRRPKSHAVFTAADTPVSGSRADSAPRLPHSRILSVKPQPTSFVSAKSIQRGAPTWVQQENVPQGNALQVGGSKLTDAAATSAAAKPIEQSYASSIPQQNVPQESTLQVGGSKLTDAAATSSPAAAKPIEQSGRKTYRAEWRAFGLHRKAFRKKARYRSMDLNRPMPPQRPRPQNLSSRVTPFDSTTKRSARKHATGRWI